MPQTPKAEFAASPTRRGTPSTSEPIPYFSGNSNGATDTDFFSLIGTTSAAETNYTTHQSVATDPQILQQSDLAPVSMQYGHVSSEQQVDFGVPPRCATGPAVEFPYQSAANQHEGPYVAAANIEAYRSASVIYGGAHHGAQRMYQTAGTGIGSDYWVPNEASRVSGVGIDGSTRDAIGNTEQQMGYSTASTYAYSGHANHSQTTEDITPGTLAYTEINGDATLGSEAALAGHTAAETANNGVMFDETIGRYYDTNSGQYYDDVSGSWYYPQQVQGHLNQEQQVANETKASTYEMPQQATQDVQGIGSSEWTNEPDGAAFFENLSGAAAGPQHQQNVNDRVQASSAVETGQKIESHGEDGTVPQTSSWGTSLLVTDDPYKEASHAAYVDKGNVVLQPEQSGQSQAIFYSKPTAPALSPATTVQLTDEWAQHSKENQALTKCTAAPVGSREDGLDIMDASMEVLAGRDNPPLQQNTEAGFVPYEAAKIGSSFVSPENETNLSPSTVQGTRDVRPGDVHADTAAGGVYADVALTDPIQPDGSEHAAFQSWSAGAKSAPSGATYNGVELSIGSDATDIVDHGIEYSGRQSLATERHFGNSVCTADGYSTPDSMAGKQAAATALRRDGARIPVVAFGVGGRMVTMHPRMVTRFGADGSETQRVVPGLLQVRTLVGVLAEKDAALPGLPILTGDTARAEVLQQRDAAVDWASALAEAPAVRALGAEEQALARVVVAVLRMAGERDAQGRALNKAVDALRPLFAEMPRVDALDTCVEPGGLHELEELLLAGRRDDAVSAASARGQWGHALAIASGAGREAFAAVVAAFAAALHDGHAALGAQYGLFSGRGAAAVTAGFGDWARTLALALANRTPGDAAAMVRLGDGLHTTPPAAAHACYVPALQRGVFEGAAPRVVLLGAPRTSRCQLAVVLTELHELSLALHAVAAGDTPHCLPHLLPYKLLRAWWLADCGHVTPAFLYCEAALRLIAALPPATASPYIMVLARELRALRERLAVAEPSARPPAASWLARAVTRPSLASLMTAVDSSIDRFIAGADAVPETAPDVSPGLFEIGPDVARVFSAQGPQAATPAVCDHAASGTLAAIPAALDPPAWGDPGVAGQLFVSASQGDLLVPAAAPGPAITSAWGYASAADSSHSLNSVAAPPHPPPPAAEEEEEDMFGFAKRPAPTSRSARPSANTAHSAPVSTRPSSDVPPAGAASKDPPIDKEPAGVFGMLKGLWASRKNQANLGEESQFVYDPALQRWVDKSAPAESQDAAPPPPPPMAMRFQSYNAVPSAPRPASALPAGFSGANGMPLLPPAAMSASANISRTVTPMTSAAPDSAAPPFASKRRGARSRYVDVLNQS
ncbi:hypothetical protein COEREDRAFT_103766 [Coemansia reversa NRRL 1564]|uniref:Protein transport protein sec16 n=1 Tax=Coemansia reversa (strain ATCC 12441 / NRRL 1564) TaxID=763665 RepID=A0A2G5B4L2_COERN|nr:hypothetical protein COEREDRAFT_103766 [Coemansia reversa NRRL 1564]|eukprot:PIA13983.1 hypothetical protein COEREDRAFT_103766 [Coemansia reversa NRRL 1564]